MSQCTLKSNRPKTVIRLGNDTPLLLALTTSLGEVINLNEVANLSVAIVSARSGRAITPPWQVTPSGGLSIEFSANNQSIGIYGLRVQFDRLSEGFADGLQAYAWEDTNLIEVVPTSTALPSDAPNTISGVLAAITKGDKGDPGNPMELLDELSRQQSVRMDEIATAQSVSLTSIGSRLSDEQRTALEELAGRLSREQGDKIAQQTERLSTEQASGLQVISDRLSSEQAQILERQAQERATAQASALQALDEQVNHKHDKALEGLSGKVSEAVEVQLPRLVEGKVAEAVDAKLPAVAGNKIAEVAERELPSVVGAQLPAALTEQLPSQLSESLPSIIGLDDQSRLTIGGQPIGESLKGADGRDAEPWDSLFSVATAKDVAIPDKVWYKDLSYDLDGACRFVDAGETGEGFLAAPKDPSYYTNNQGVADLKERFGNACTIIYRVPISKYLIGGRRFVRASVGYWASVYSVARLYIPGGHQIDKGNPTPVQRTGDLYLYLDVTGINAKYAYVIVANKMHRIWYNSLDVFVDAPVTIEYYGTWLGRPKAPKRGQSYLCSNIASLGDATYPIQLSYTGHKWVTAWGATIQGETTEEAQQSFNGAVQALKSILSDA